MLRATVNGLIANIVIVDQKNIFGKLNVNLATERKSTVSIAIVRGGINMAVAVPVTESLESGSIPASVTVEVNTE